MAGARVAVIESRVVRWRGVFRGSLLQRRVRVGLVVVVWVAPPAGHSGRLVTGATGLTWARLPWPPGVCDGSGRARLSWCGAESSAPYHWPWCEGSCHRATGPPDHGSLGAAHHRRGGSGRARLSWCGAESSAPYHWPWCEGSCHRATGPPHGPGSARRDLDISRAEGGSGSMGEASWRLERNGGT